MYRNINRLPRSILRVSRGQLAAPKMSHFRTQSSVRLIQARYNSSSKHNTPASNHSDQTLKTDQPQLMIAFTCKKCDTRSSHTFSKQSYTKGSVLIQCPGCKNRHLIADNLNIFRDNKINLEDILKAKGESVATTTDDLAFEDIPESLRKTLGHYAKDAPEEYQLKNDNPTELAPGKES